MLACHLGNYCRFNYLAQINLEFFTTKIWLIAIVAQQKGVLNILFFRIRVSIDGFFICLQLLFRVRSILCVVNFKICFLYCLFSFKFIFKVFLLLRCKIIWVPCCCDCPLSFLKLNLILHKLHWKVMLNFFPVFVRKKSLSINTVGH